MQVSVGLQIPTHIAFVSTVHLYIPTSSIWRVENQMWIPCGFTIGLTHSVWHQLGPSTKEKRSTKTERTSQFRCGWAEK